MRGSSTQETPLCSAAILYSAIRLSGRDRVPPGLLPYLNRPREKPALDPGDSGDLEILEKPIKKLAAKRLLLY